MKTKAVAALLLGVSLFAGVAVAKQSDPYSRVIQQLENQYHAKKKHIPFLGLGNFVLKFWHPAGVEAVQVSLFENPELYGQVHGERFDSVVESAAAGSWRPVVREFSRRSNQWVYVYYTGEGKDMKILVVSLDPSNAVVAQVKFQPAKLAEFAQNPSMFGHSLANDLRNQAENPGSPGDLVEARTSDQHPEGPADDAPGVTATDATDGGTPAVAPREAPVLHREDPRALGYREDPASGDARPSDRSSNTSSNTASGAEKSIKLEARLINLNVSAVNHSGIAAPNLTKENFSVFEDGVKQNISFFETNQAPVNLMLLLDLSGSTSKKIKLIKKAASRFVDSLLPADRIAVAAFTRRFYQISDFTTDHALLKERIDRTKNLEGGTAYYDAMWTAMNLLDKAGDSRKALVVLTDGVDEHLLDPKDHPSKHSYEQMLSRISEDDVTVYPIYLDTEWYEVKRSGNGAHEAYAAARTQLYAVADETGGTVLKAVDDADLDGAYQKVAAELHSLYSMAYAPKELHSDGRWHDVHVKIDRTDVVVRARRGFYDK